MIFVPGLVKVMCDRDALNPKDIGAAISEVSIDSVGPALLVDEL